MPAPSQRVHEYVRQLAEEALKKGRITPEQYQQMISGEGMEVLQGASPTGMAARAGGQVLPKLLSQLNMRSPEAMKMISDVARGAMRGGGGGQRLLGPGAGGNLPVPGGPGALVPRGPMDVAVGAARTIPRGGGGVSGWPLGIGAAAGTGLGLLAGLGGRGKDPDLPAAKPLPMPLPIQAPTEMPTMGLPRRRPPTAKVQGRSLDLGSMALPNAQAQGLLEGPEGPLGSGGELVEGQDLDSLMGGPAPMDAMGGPEGIDYNEAMKQKRGKMGALLNAILGRR